MLFYTHTMHVIWLYKLLQKLSYNAVHYIAGTVKLSSLQLSHVICRVVIMYTVNIDLRHHSLARHLLLVYCGIEHCIYLIRTLCSIIVCILYHSSVGRLTRVYTIEFACLYCWTCSHSVGIQHYLTLCVRTCVVYSCWAVDRFAVMMLNELWWW